MPTETQRITGYQATTVASAHARAAKQLLDAVDRLTPAELYCFTRLLFRNENVEWLAARAAQAAQLEARRHARGHLSDAEREDYNRLARAFYDTEGGLVTVPSPPWETR